MSYGIASHGYWCGAKTYPTRCRFCSDRVYYFECNCGSKVFFSSLGTPWTTHTCLGYLTATHGKEFVAKGMALQMMKHPASTLHTKIEKRYEEEMRKALAGKKRTGKRAWTEAIKCHQGGAFQGVAAVRSIIKNIDTRIRFDIPDTPMAAQLLGKLAGSHHQITVNVGDFLDGAHKSYTFLIAAQLIDRLDIRIGDMALVTLHAHTTITGQWYWNCIKIEYPI